MTTVLHRRIAHQTIGETPVLAALRLRLPGKAPGIRLVLPAGVAVEPLGLEAAGLRQGIARSVGGSAVVSAIWDGVGELPSRAGPIALIPAEPDLLAGMDVVLGIRNGDPEPALRDWLAYHATQHGAQGALIVDRLRPGDPGLSLDGLEIDGLDMVVIVTFDFPLGGPNPSERHPASAPDAPGKDRMTVPEPDPWTAPLAQVGIFEAVRWGFLARAAAVASLDTCDLLVPGSAPFDAARAAPAGVVPLLGRRIYPWRLRKGEAAGFGDHVCDQFDAAGGNRRWVCCPTRIAEDQPWRLVRVGGINPDPLSAQYFLRAMAVRVTEGGDLPLAPKAALTPDDMLVDLASRHFGHKPVLPPAAPEIRPGALPAALPGRTAIVTCMKNEGPFILEWLAHHRAIGVDDFLIYTNDCTDGTDTLLDLLQSHGIVEHRANPFRDPGYEDMRPQHAALAAAEAEPVMARAGWGICMDVDEFINIHVGTGHLEDLYQAVGNANMISLTWRLFGNSDAARFDERPTPQRFTRCAPQLIRKPHQAWGFKTLFRNMDIYKKMGVHRPKGLRPELWEEIDWVNGSGHPMPREMLRNGWRSTLETYGYELVTLNHYAVRDAESFLVKRDRGRVNHVARDQGLGYWFRMNNNAVEDRSMLRHMPGLGTEMARLLALPGVAEAHLACIAAHRARIEALRATDAFAAFYEEITSPRMQRLSRMHAHFGANVFLAGPDAVPDAIVFADHPEDFFFTVEAVDETRH